MSSRIKRYGAATTPLDRDGICAAQQTTSGTALTLNGALTSVKVGSAGTKEFVGADGRAVCISLYSAADMTTGGKAVVVSGFADFARNEALSETILLPNATYVLGTKHFAVVTSIVPNGTIAQNLEVGTDADATSATSSTIFVPLDFRNSTLSVQATATGTITAVVSVSKDPILDGTVTLSNAAIVTLTGLDAVTGTEHAAIPAGSTLLKAVYSAATASEGLTITVVESASP